jgi:hypothetical protein
MDKLIDTHHKIDKHQAKATDELSKLINECSLVSASKSKHIRDIDDDTKLSIKNSEKMHQHPEKKDDKNNMSDHSPSEGINKLNSSSENNYSGDMRSIFDRVNNLCDSLSRNLISHEEFTRFMEQVKKDKEELEEAYRKDTIKHRVEDYQGMLSVFTEGSQAFLTTKAAISQLSSML